MIEINDQNQRIKSNLAGKKRFDQKSENRRVTLNIGGQIFQTYINTLLLFGDSRLSNLSKTNSNYDSLKKVTHKMFWLMNYNFNNYLFTNFEEFFFDRDPNSFQAILNYYRSGHLHTPQHTCANLFHEELEYWGIAEQEIQPCCWTGYHIRRDCNQVFNKVIREINTGKQDIFQSKELTSFLSPYLY